MRTLNHLPFIQLVSLQAISIFLLLISVNAHGQTGESASANTTEISDTGTEDTPPPLAGAPDASSSTSVDAARDDDIARVREEIAALNTAYETRLAEEIAAVKEDYNSRLNELEAAQYKDYSEEDSDPGLHFFGFFDLAFMYKRITDDTFIAEGDGIVNTSPQFLLQHINLYATNQLTERLSFMAEVQFSFLPNGGMTPEFTGSKRLNTVVVDPYTQQQYRYGSIIIQRAWLKWEPSRYLGIKAGYFLSPYGIWHEDHASPVRLSILPPFQNNTLTPPEILGKFPVPKTQLGVQLFGQVFPGDSLKLDYALTVSNGRGSADTVVDYDDNKGLGMRLRLTYHSTDARVSLGAYGYLGEYTDKFFGIWREKMYENYREYSLATAFLAEIRSVRLQSEYIRSVTRYNDDARPMSVWRLGEDYVTPDYESDLFYVLLAYQLPFADGHGDHTVTPYVSYEFDRPRDTIAEHIVQLVNFGLNYKPSSSVVLKAEGSRFHLTFVQDSVTTVWTAATQLAVSF